MLRRIKRLEQATQRGWVPVHDNQFAGHLCLGLPLIGVAVADVQALEVEAVEDTPDVRVVVNADHHLALTPAHEIGHTFVLLEGSPRFVHKAEATAGLAGRVCGFGGPGWMLAHLPGSPLFI